MKKLLFGVCFILFALGISAQNLDRVSLNSGGLVSNKMYVVIGELFVFNIENHEGQSLEAGSLASLSNTGGIKLQATEVTAAKPQHKVLCYPNPVKEQLMFSVDQVKNTLLVIHVIDMSGSIIIQARTDSPENTKLDVSTLKPGQYILKLKTSNNLDIASFKFIKQ